MSVWGKDAIATAAPAADKAELKPGAIIALNGQLLEVVHVEWYRAGHISHVDTLTEHGTAIRFSPGTLTGWRLVRRAPVVPDTAVLATGASRARDVLAFIDLHQR